MTLTSDKTTAHAAWKKNMKEKNKTKTFLKKRKVSRKKAKKKSVVIIKIE